MITVTRSSLPPFEEYCNEINDIWESHWLTNMGTKHKQLQEELEAFCGTNHVTLYTNGHLALENIIAAMNFPQGSEVITTPFTFVSTTHAIVRNGLVPVFCDINEFDYTIDATKIESLITEKTVAILPVHVYGNMCDVDAIDVIAKRHGLKVIYDAAHAFGVAYKGRNSACFGDASMFSFHATKVFNTIEGGAVCYNDDNLVQVLNDMKNFGIRGPESCEYIGGNAKMSEFQAAMGICNLRHLDEEISKRQHDAQKYDDLLRNEKGISVRCEKAEQKSNFAYYPVVFDPRYYDRENVFNTLLENDIIARKYFYPLTCDFKCYSKLIWNQRTNVPIARTIADNVLTLPLYADLDEKEVGRIVEIIKRTKKLV